MSHTLEAALSPPLVRRRALRAAPTDRVATALLAVFGLGLLASATGKAFSPDGLAGTLATLTVPEAVQPFGVSGVVAAEVWLGLHLLRGADGFGLRLLALLLAGSFAVVQMALRSSAAPAGCGCLGFWSSDPTAPLAIAGVGLAGSLLALASAPATALRARSWSWRAHTLVALAAGALAVLAASSGDARRLRAQLLAASATHPSVVIIGNPNCGICADLEQHFAGGRHCYLVHADDAVGAATPHATGCTTLTVPRAAWWSLAQAQVPAVYEVGNNGWRRLR